MSFWKTNTPVAVPEVQLWMELLKPIRFYLDSAIEQRNKNIWHFQLFDIPKRKAIGDAAAVTENGKG